MKTEATHYVECFENVGRGKKRRLFQECVLIRYVGDEMAKVMVINGVRCGIEGVRYVNRNRLINMYV